MNNDLSENNVLFVRLQRGISGVSYGTVILLVNDSPERELEFVYTKDDKHEKFSIKFDNILNVSYSSRISVSNNDKKVIEYDTKSMLLSFAVFGTNPLLRLFAERGIKVLFESATNNYDRINLNTEYQIDINYMVDGEEKKIILISTDSPEKFVNLLLKIK